MIKAISTPNIALIKYWGNRSNELRIPAADSLSMTLDQPSVEVTVDHADQFSVRSFEEDNTERQLTKSELSRIEQHLALTKLFFTRLEMQNAIPASIKVEIHSHIPASIGLASSAAVFSALAEAYAGLAADTRPISRKEISMIARLGSGSASRSVYGGFAAMVVRNDEAYAEQIADENHWKLHDVIIIPSRTPKEVGSTEGHALAHTSPLFQKRLDAIPRRQQECIDAILTKNFEKLQNVAEEDALDMHNVMQTSVPALTYLNDETYRILDEVDELRTDEHLEVLYTMDAGPTVHLICTEAALPKIRAYAAKQSGCHVFEAGVGKGSHLI
ncbi:diphosphomevalonate decarboxylase [Candidatus Peribacteria bacterium RIFCSPHIGHO2_01_FULL_51_9]|nr:MAG: diphosphomevalonate decarboxylase [Candidatus Peribacteria bacterium RIFCSPHIGHO2_01_FULL_51_9]